MCAWVTIMGSEKEAKKYNYEYKVFKTIEEGRKVIKQLVNNADNIIFSQATLGLSSELSKNQANNWESHGLYLSVE